MTNINFLCGRLSFKKQEFDSCFILQTAPDILAKQVQTVCLGSRMSYFILPVLQILFINIIVARGFTSKNASKEINPIIFRFHQSEAVSTLKMKLYRMKGKLGGGGAYKIVGGGR